MQQQPEPETVRLGRAALSLIADARDSDEPARLDEAVALLDRAIAGTPQHDDVTLPVHFAALGAALQLRFELLGDPADLDRAIEDGRRASAACPAGHSAHTALRSNLAVSLVARADRTGRPEDLQEAVSQIEEALRLTPDGDPNRPLVLKNAAQTFLALFRRTRTVSDLDRAETLVREALVSHTQRSAWSTYADIQLARHEVTKLPEDLDTAITVCRRAVRNEPAGSRRWASSKSSYALLLLHRYRATGGAEDVAAAVQACGEALSHLPEDSPERASHLAVLAEVLHERHRRDRQPDDLLAAVDAMTRAVRASRADDPVTPRRLATLADWSAGTDRPAADADVAIDTATEAVAAATMPDRGRAEALDALARAHRTRYEQTGAPTHLDAAVQAARDALEAAEDDPPAARPTSRTWASAFGSGSRRAGPRRTSRRPWRPSGSRPPRSPPGTATSPSTCRA